MNLPQANVPAYLVPFPAVLAQDARSTYQMKPRCWLTKILIPIRLGSIQNMTSQEEKNDYLRNTHESPRWP